MPTAELQEGGVWAATLPTCKHLQAHGTGVERSPHDAQDNGLPRKT